jgi:transcription-repair coupling factor (superfamily II helicase)
VFVLHPSASLAFRSLLKSAATRAGLTRSIPRLAGLGPGAMAFHASALAQDGPVVLVVPTDPDVEQMTADARFFLSAIKGLSDAQAEQAVLPFPSQEVDPYRGLAPHLEVASARARALAALATGQAQLVIASARALPPRLSHPARLADASIVLKPGTDIAIHDLASRLVDAGFTREDPVDQHGEFSIRGGVVDLYPTSEAQPIRLEFIGDIIESVRRFDAATQRSLSALGAITLTPQRELLPRQGLKPLPSEHDEADEELDRSATFIDYVRRASATVLVYELDDVTARGLSLEEQWRASSADAVARNGTAPPYEYFAMPWEDAAAWLERASRVTQLALEDTAGESHVPSLPVLEYHGRIGDWVGEINRARERGDTIVFVAASTGRAERTIELLADYDVRARAIGDNEDLARATVLVTTGHLSRGFHLPTGNLLLFAETDLFEEERRSHERRKSASRSFISDFRDLKVGDLVVHVDNGIGRFVGLKTMAAGAGMEAQEFMELRYAGEDKLFVPLDRLDLVQKYTGGAAPALDKLGGTTWEKAKTRVKKAMRDMAEELLKLYAARKAVTGHAFTADSHWQQEFDDAFEFDLTADQAAAIADISKDMESTMPMDRLLCGDVGYGKTEVAMRAAFKAVMDGKQVAFLAPTTVLAFQHERTLKERFAGFPVRIDMISRFRTKTEQQNSLEKLANGQLDIIVGTHRLLSKDVVFRDLGLLVVDEEQRFGVVHKERIKQLRKKVDVLTMTATPIPRTLNMSLVGIRDMSVIETPPRDRLAIQTHVVKFDQEVITRAIRTEIERGGQVYFVHNRVESIFSIANLIQRLLPEVRIGIGHGQMGEGELEKVMVDFVAHKFDVLVSTTIVENGLDIANANTIVINRADRYGLSQLYQLRGRVGRSDRRAYAYLLIPPEQSLSPVARKRLAAIREFSDLGSGFRIAALDLEIRGAGNLLGGQQSGHIEAVGFDMYTKLLEETIRELKGEELEDDRRASVNLKLNLKIDEAYIPDMNQRLAAYRRLASARSIGEVDSLITEFTDRYGRIPETMLNLAEYARIRALSDRLSIDNLEREGNSIVFKFRPDAKLEPTWLLKLVETRGDLTLLPPAILRLDLTKPVDPPKAATPSKPAVTAPGRLNPKTVIRAKPEAPPPGRESWWATRATAGEVSGGFSRSEILAETAPDPRAPGGIFERVRQVLDELSRRAGLT